jgi:hypothetical protein
MPVKSAPGTADSFRPWIANGYIEEYFTSALSNYVTFARTQLNLTLPLGVEAGLVGIKNYALAMKNGYVGGKALRDVIRWHGQVTAYDENGLEVLAPFFSLIWDNCGFHRPAIERGQG